MNLLLVLFILINQILKKSIQINQVMAVLH